MMFIIHIQNLRKIDRVVSDIIFLSKSTQTADRQTDGRTENGKLFIRTLRVIAHREIMKVARSPMDSITILPQLTLGK